MPRGPGPHPQSALGEEPGLLLLFSTAEESKDKGGTECLERGPRRGAEGQCGPALLVLDPYCDRCWTQDTGEVGVSSDGTDVTSLICSRPSLARDHRTTWIEESLILPLGHLGLFFREGISLLKEPKSISSIEVYRPCWEHNLFAKEVLTKKTLNEMAFFLQVRS